MHWTSLLQLGLAACLHLVAAQDYTCSATKPCAIGCCSSTGVCGMGPDYCGETCISDCDRKSECNPGWGVEWSAADKCPLNVCCSKFGFCGTTEEFCGTTTVATPQCSGGSSATKRTIGYYEGWSVTRGCDQMYPESLPVGAYTHLNFAFAFIDPTTFQVAPMSEGDEALYKRFTGLKNLNSGLQTWISIGGWSMNDPDQPTATTFSDLAGSESAQQKFFASLLSFMETYGFDGVDIDWEYPVAEERSGKPEDYANYPTFLQNLRNAMSSSGHNYGLTITIPTSYWYLQHFDIVAIEKVVDWINVMSYDLHGTWDSTNVWTGPYIYAHTNLTEITTALELLWRNNIDPDHVVLGLGFYGRSFTLADPSCNTPGCVFTSGGNPGSCTASAGTLSFAEIEQIIAAGATVQMDVPAAVKMVTWGGDQWVSYDDTDTIKMKVDYANNHCLGGMMVWAASTDDAQGSAAAALASITGRAVISLAVTTSASQIATCQFSGCDETCPNGFSAVQSSSGTNSLGINRRCERNPPSSKQTYCCPSDDMPTCTWRGTAPFCNGKCQDGEVEVTSDGYGDGSACWTGHKVLCCTETVSTGAAGECEWNGSAPSCPAAGTCPQDQVFIASSEFGAGGEQGCWTGAKSLCCNNPPPYQNCEWSASITHHALEIRPYLCEGYCVPGKTPIATDSTGCMYGSKWLCCDAISATTYPTVEKFKEDLQTFAANPGCTTAERLYTKRDEPLAKRDLLSMDRAVLFGEIAGVAMMGNTPTYESVLMKDLFNDGYGLEYGLSTDQVHSGIQDSWYTEPITTVEELMCLGSGAGALVQEFETSMNELLVDGCELTVSRRSLDLPDDSLSIRNLLNSAQDRAGILNTAQPSWGHIVRGIIADGSLFTLQYQQIIWPENQRSPLVEIVWQIPTGTAGNTYRETANDLYVVFHFHFTHMRRFGGDGAPFLPAITAIGAFHSQGTYIADYGQVRTQWQAIAGANQRTQIMSVLRAGTVWYPTYNLNGPTAEWGQMIQEFGEFLFAQRLLVEQTFTDAARGNLVRSNPDNQGCASLSWRNWDDGEIEGYQFQPPPA